MNKYRVYFISGHGPTNDPYQEYVADNTFVSERGELFLVYNNVNILIVPAGNWKLVVKV